MSERAVFSFDAPVASILSWQDDEDFQGTTTAWVACRKCEHLLGLLTRHLDAGELIGSEVSLSMVYVVKRSPHSSGEPWYAVPARVARGRSLRQRPIKPVATLPGRRPRRLDLRDFRIKVPRRRRVWVDCEGCRALNHIDQYVMVPIPAAT